MKTKNVNTKTRDLTKEPEVSILVLTYNRKELLKRNLESIFKQTYKNYEILLLDDMSTDGTEEFIKTLKDPRIRYYRNEENMGSRYGDWWAIRKAIYELMRGKYFIYLCDDDFWNPDYVLETLVDKFYRYPNLSIAFGIYAHMYDAPISMPEDMRVKGFKNCYVTKNMYPSGYMTGIEYLSNFSGNPCGKNYLEGGALFSREKLTDSGAFKEEKGTKWQAGYMFKMGPAAIGDIYFIDEPYVIATINSTNASFTQSHRVHFLDCIESIAGSYQAIQQSRTFMQFSRIEKRVLKVLYRKTFNNLTAEWFGNQVSSRAGVEFPGVARSYFADRITFLDFFRVLCKIRFMPSIKALKAVILGNVPKPILVFARKVL